MTRNYFLKAFLLIVFSVLVCFSREVLAESSGVSQDKNETNNVEVIVISDIDDTIESSHVRGNPLRELGHALNYHDAFFGMSLLYRALAENGARVIYVSGMPSAVDRIIHAATEFLATNSFPGEYILRQSTDEDTYSFKDRTITSYLESLQKTEPDKKFYVIAPGDNGEQDIRVLDTVSKNFPDVKFDIYIHKIYENGVLKILPKQMPFYTAADLAVQIYNSEINQDGKLLNQEQLAKVFAEVQDGLSDPDQDTRSLVIPHWAELTRKDQKNIQALLLQTPSELTVKSKQLMTSIQDRIRELDHDFVTTFHLPQENGQCGQTFK